MESHYECCKSVVGVGESFIHMLVDIALLSHFAKSNLFVISLYEFVFATTAEEIGVGADDEITVVGKMLCEEVCSGC